MRLGGVLQEPVPNATDTFRETAPTATVVKDGVVTSFGTALLCQAGRQDAHRNSHQVRRDLIMCMIITNYI